MKNEPDLQRIIDAVDVYAKHLQAIEVIFNDHSRSIGLGIKLDVSKAVAVVQSGSSAFTKAMRFVEREDDSGVLHDAQLMTALDAVGELLTNPERNGLILGAMQSGKTTTSLAMQFAGPITYLLRGRCLYPIYLITSQTSQEDQTKSEIGRFLDFYGDVWLSIDEDHGCSLIDYVKRLTDPGFQFSPTVNTYREYILKQALRDTYMGPRLDDFIHRRAPGESIKEIAKLCKLANSKGFTPLLLIDEPQFGASDRLIKIGGEIERRPCVLLQIFDRIDQALGAGAHDRVFIGLSATPYELHDVSSVWKVPQYLKSTYSGFNFFGGKIIDASADINPPNVITFSKLSEQLGLDFLQNVSLAAYDAPSSKFKRLSNKIGFAGTQVEYQKKVEKTLHDAIMTMARRGDAANPSGICIRLFNNNAKSHRLLDRLHLNKDEIDVIEYFGSEYTGQSVKRAIRERKRPDLPFLVAVTNRARMGDAFPQRVEWFLEFSKKAADLNALLQGLLGRACGYGKRSTVVMSQDNADLVEDYQRTKGDYIYKTSRHSIVVGPYRRGAPTALVRLKRDMDDPLIAEFFTRIDSQIVEHNIIQPSKNLRAKRASGDEGYRTGPILLIAEELGLFEHLEKPEVRESLFPTYPSVRIVRRGETVASLRDPQKILGYSLDDAGNCRFTFRRYEGAFSHGGIRSRGYGKSDAKNKDRAGNTLEPQVNMVKFDPATKQAIEDPDVEGNWCAVAVTLPLLKPVREVRAGKRTYPVAHSPFAKLLNDVERAEAEDAAEDAAE